VEYGLPMIIGIAAKQTNTSGTVTSTSKFINNVDLGLRNQSLIGIVL
jgi:hypothetical protein